MSLLRGRFPERCCGYRIEASSNGQPPAPAQGSPNQQSFPVIPKIAFDDDRHVHHLPSGDLVNDPLAQRVRLQIRCLPIFTNY